MSQRKHIFSKIISMLGFESVVEQERERQKEEEEKRPDDLEEGKEGLPDGDVGKKAQRADEPVKTRLEGAPAESDEKKTGKSGKSKKEADEEVEQKGEKPKEEKSLMRSLRGSGEEEDEEKKKRLSDRISDTRQTVEDMFERVIEPEERTLSNYFNVNFWRDKYGKYQTIRKKEEGDLSTHQALSAGATPTREYYILTILSTVIATAGLIMGSTAVVIGAMIVAPLMTPILALSLGVVWGDLRLMRNSLVSIMYGSFLAVLISAFMAFLLPEASYTDEILARAQPGLYDIVVGIASGLVGAYGFANKKVSSSLVGIAIAVALLPPLCTVGIGLGFLDAQVALGALVLFIINLATISLAGALVFWILKIHPFDADKEEVKRRALSQIVLSLVLLLLIALPLAYFTYDRYRLRSAISDAESAMEKSLPHARVLDMTTERIDSGTGEVVRRYRMLILLTDTDTPEPEVIKKMEDAIIGDGNVIRDVRVEFFRSELLVE
ncbi:MAG: TIGR00341 family protein [Deltaproteobacteria bacterium]|nr:TIGR00341 family protein [Candidatus Zymogenaceae bacterium]